MTACHVFRGLLWRAVAAKRFVLKHDGKKSKNKARNTMNPEGTIELKATDDVSQSTDAVCEIVRILTRFRSRDERRNIMNAVAAFCIDDR